MDFPHVTFVFPILSNSKNKNSMEMIHSVTKGQMYLTPSAVFVASECVCGVDFSPVSRDRSVGGSYLGCEPMGLFWSLQPAPGAREGLRQVMDQDH